MTGAVLVVIPCLNEEAHLPGLLDQLLADGADTLIVVADGGSTDASRDIVQRFMNKHGNVILLDNPDRVQSAGVNRAVAAFGAGRRWMVRMDAHCRYPDRFVTRLLASAKARDVVSVVVPMVTEGRACFQIACATAQNSVLGTGGSSHRHIGEGRYVEHGHHALMAIDAFVRVGGYNQAMSHNEDAELDHRLGREGRIWLEPDCALTYFPRSGARALWRQYFGYGKGRAQTIGMHRMKPRPRQMVPLAVPVVIVLAIVAGPISPVFVLPLLGWALLCLGTGAMLGFRRRSVCAALSGVSAMIMHAAWGFGFIRQMLSGQRLPHISMLSRAGT